MAEPFGVLARWQLALGLIHLIVTMGLLLINYRGLINLEVFLESICYLLLGIFSLGLRSPITEQFHIRLYTSLYRLAVLVNGISLQSSIFDSCAGNDGWEGCHSIVQACWWVMVLLNCLEIIVDCLMYYDPLRSGIEEVPLPGYGEVRAAVGLFAGVLIRCGRVLGDTDELVVWRLGLGTMGAALLTVVLGGFGSVMTPNVFCVCLALGFLETILVCASRQEMLDVSVRFRYIFVSVIKIVLVGNLILANYLHSFTESSGCKEGSACYSHLRQCFWVMLVFYFLEMFLAVLLLFAHHPRQYKAKNILASFFGVTLTVSSALSMTHVVLVGLLLGGSYGPLMTAKGFWLCVSTLFAEMAALMSVTGWAAKVLRTQIDSEKSLLGTNSASTLVLVLRIGGLAIISGFLQPEDDNFFIADMSNCDETCKARGSDLLAICWWAGFFQVYLIVLSLLLIHVRLVRHRQGIDLEDCSYFIGKGN